MANPKHPNVSREDRRAFLRASAAVAGWTLLSGSASARAGVRLSRRTGGGAGPPRTLVLLQLSGGNDGLNAVPFHGDDQYYNLRPDLALDRNDVLVLDDYRGLHPDLRNLWELYDQGRVALIEGVGYPEPNRSHFKSLEIWHTARLEGRNSGDGWIGRLMEELHPGAPAANRVVHVGSEVPYALYSTRHPPVAFEVPSGYAWAGNAGDVEALAEGVEREAPGTGGAIDARTGRLAWLRSVAEDARQSSVEIRAAADGYHAHEKYPRGERLADALQTVAALVHGDLGSQVFSVELGGFDTHNGQLGRQRRQLRTLDAALGAFLRDLSHTEEGRNTTVLVFSEFGRRPMENASGGTDHGTAGPVIALGAPVQGGLYGAPPSLTDLDDNGDLVYTTDFRSVYATLIGQWLGADPAPVLGGEYTPLDFLTGKG